MNMTSGIKNSIELIYAGGSPRRLACLQQIPGVEVTAVGGGFEPNIREVGRIAELKISRAKQHLYRTNPNPLVQENNHKVLVAVDARTEIPIVDSRGNIAYLSMGKPKDLTEVLNNFKLILSAAANSGAATYRVVCASLLDGGKLLRKETIQSSITLSEENLKYLVSSVGFMEYLRTFEKIEEKISPFDVSGGLSLSVLVSMGLVENIDGVSLRNATQAEIVHALKCGLLTVACGFGVNVLNSVHPKALETILEWHWLQTETQNILSSGISM
jgi:hypothetical protein